MTRAAPASNLPHSVHDRLLAPAKKRGRPFNELLQYYAMERFLYRLSRSPAHKYFVLKGALLLTARADMPYRPTRDIDLLGWTDNTEGNIRDLMQQACRQNVTADGLRFDPETVTTERIKEDADYAGVRVQFLGHLDNARVAMQVDVGFGDIITPAPDLITYPALLDFPAPRLRAYTLETTVAEKVQAMVYLGELNSRMKDFYDVWMLCQHAALDSQHLQRAIAATFAQRKTPIPLAPVCFTPAFAKAKQTQWRAFLRKLRNDKSPESLSAVIQLISKTITPIFREVQKL